jgi:hypothetical protein
MAKQTINIGTAPNDGTGTPLRTAFDYCNLNFTELYTAVGPSGNNIVVPGTATITGNLTVRTNGLVVDSNGASFSNATPLSGTDAGLVLGSIGTIRQFTLGLFNVYARIRERDNSNNLSISTNSNDAGTKDDATKSSWKLRIGSGNDNFALQRAPVGSNTFSDLLIIDSAGVATFGDGAGGTRMTLDSNGLGLGGVPNTYVNYKTLAVVGGSAGGVIDLNPSGGVTAGGCQIGGTATTTTVSAVGPNAGAAASLVLQTGTFGSLLPRVTIDGLGNTISNVNSAIPSLGTNSQMVFNLTTNTNLRISVRGTDGTTRVANITLA